MPGIVVGIRDTTEKNIVPVLWELMSGVDKFYGENLWRVGE